MGMMDGGTNFRDNCKTCNKDEDGGTMRRYVHDRNIKLCLDCFEKLDVVKRQEYVVTSQLRRNRLL
jgi:hypothetical protein